MREMDGNGRVKVGSEGVCGFDDVMGWPPVQRAGRGVVNALRAVEQARGMV